MMRNFLHTHVVEAVSQIPKQRLAGLLAGCFVAPQSQIHADMLLRRASPPAKIPRNPLADYL